MMVSRLSLRPDSWPQVAFGPRRDEANRLLEDTIEVIHSDRLRDCRGFDVALVAILMRDDRHLVCSVHTILLGGMDPDRPREGVVEAERAVGVTVILKQLDTMSLCECHQDRIDSNLRGLHLLPLFLRAMKAIRHVRSFSPSATPRHEMWEIQEGERMVAA